MYTPQPPVFQGFYYTDSNEKSWKRKSPQARIRQILSLIHAHYVLIKQGKQVLLSVQTGLLIWASPHVRRHHFLKPFSVKF